MNIPSIITYVITIAIVLLVFKIFSFPLKIFLKLLINSLIGALILTLFNYFGNALIGFTIPITWVSALVVGLLGIPGVVIMIIVRLFM